MRTARSFSLSFVGFMSIMRLDATFPQPTPRPSVVRMFSTSFVAVPAPTLKSHAQRAQQQIAWGKECL